MSPTPPRVLIVDDEPLVLSTLQQTLERSGFHVVACSSPRKALSVLEDQDFAVILSDQRMPEMSGLEFMVAGRELRPHATRILITAVLELPTIIAAINRGEIYRFVAKPWLREELLATVREAVQRHEISSRKAELERLNTALSGELAEARAQMERQASALNDERSRSASAQKETALLWEGTLSMSGRLLTDFDPVLGIHARDLRDLAGRMAKAGAFSQEERRILVSASTLCDLGLVSLPRESLGSSHGRIGSLTEADLELLRKHPLYSQSLAALIDPSRELGEAIRAHHERFDGTGYPDGLRGDAIPWTARCLAVAAEFVGCGLPRSAAIERIASAGRAHDPEAVRLLLGALPTKPDPQRAAGGSANLLVYS